MSDVTELEEISLDLEMIAARLRRSAARMVGLQASVNNEAAILDDLAKRLRGGA